MGIEENLKQKIQDFLKCHCVWTNGNIRSRLDLDILERKNLGVNTNGCFYKYIEYTKLNQSGKICVGIGFNPAEGLPDKIDHTNIKIIKALKKLNYEAFILLNLYPLVTQSKDKFDELDKRNVEFNKKCLPLLLEYILSETNEDVLVFWGRTVSVEREVFEKIQKLNENDRLYMTVKEGESIHCHPARVPVEIKKVTYENIKETYSIR